MEYKKCSKCKEIKPLEDFNNSASKDGKTSYCKKCNNIYNKKYYDKNKKQLIEQAKKYYYKNKDKMDFYKRDYYKDYYSKNKTKILENRKIYAENNYLKIWSSATLNRHKHSGYIINVNSSYVENLASKTLYCPFCGCKLDWKYGTKLNGFTPTLDRINNENELREDNIQIICHRCNSTKFDRNMKDFIIYCKLIANKFGDTV